MTHLRPRYILPLIKSKLKFAPVVAIQGARQTGKSFIARDLLSTALKDSSYVTFDQKSVRAGAQKRPDSFIAEGLNYKPFIIDEAQKVPDIFDAIKYAVDQKRTPGQFVILGSTEFSTLMKIRESLTGRMSRVRLFPLTIGESRLLPLKRDSHPLSLEAKPRISRADLLRYLSSGGMPGLFTIKNVSERNVLLNDWLTLTIERDIHLIPRLSLDSDLCSEILQRVATLEEPSLARIVMSLKVNTKIVIKHIRVLQTLFVLNTLEPHPLGTGKELYFLVDVAFATLLGASFERQLWTMLLNEQLAYRTYLEQYKKLSYYRTSKGSFIHLVVDYGKGKTTALKILPEESFDSRDLLILSSFANKFSNQPELIGYSAMQQANSKEKIKLYSWEAIG